MLLFIKYDIAYKLPNIKFDVAYNYKIYKFFYNV